MSSVTGTAIRTVLAAIGSKGMNANVFIIGFVVLRTKCCHETVNNGNADHKYMPKIIESIKVESSDNETESFDMRCLMKSRT